MDEPLGALDKKLRDQMQLEIKRIHRELGTTIVYVTHDQEEAMTMSDRICLMNGGRIEQLGTPADLYFRAAHAVRGRLPRRVEPAARQRVERRIGRRRRRDARRWRRPASRRRRMRDCASGDKVRVMVRPQNIARARRRRRRATAARPRASTSMITGSLTKLYVERRSPATPPIVAAIPTSRRGAAARDRQRCSRLSTGRPRRGGRSPMSAAADAMSRASAAARAAARALGPSAAWARRWCCCSSCCWSTRSASSCC